MLGFWICQGYTRFWIKYYVIDVWQYSEYALGSEYATVLNMLGSHKIGNNIFHHKYLTGFWICFEFWKYQCYTEFSRKASHTCLTGFWVLNIQGLEYKRVMNMPRLHTVLPKLYFKNFQILNVLISEYAKVSNVSGVSKYAIIKGSEWNTSSYIFDRVPNIPRFQKMSGFWICQVSLRKHYII